MEVFGSWEAIVEASAEPVDALEPGRRRGPERRRPGRGRVRGREPGREVVTFGRRDDADVRAEAVALDADGRRARSTSCAGGRREPVRLAVPGEHMVQQRARRGRRRLGARRAARRRAPTALARARGRRAWRMETFETPDGGACPQRRVQREPRVDGGRAADRRWMAGDGRADRRARTRWPSSATIAPREHERVGELAARLRRRPADHGRDRGEADRGRGVRERGRARRTSRATTTPTAALEDVRAHARAGDLVLVKASRVVGLEPLAEALR